MNKGGSLMKWYVWEQQSNSFTQLKKYAVKSAQFDYKTSKLILK